MSEDLKRRVIEYLELPFVLVGLLILKLVELVFRFFLWLVPKRVTFHLMTFLGGRIVKGVMGEMEAKERGGEKDDKCEQNN